MTRRSHKRPPHEVVRVHCFLALVVLPLFRLCHRRQHMQRPRHWPRDLLRLLAFDCRQLCAIPIYTDPPPRTRAPPTLRTPPRPPPATIMRIDHTAYPHIVAHHSPRRHLHAPRLPRHLPRLPRPGRPLRRTRGRRVRDAEVRPPSCAHCAPRPGPAHSRWRATRASP